MKGVLNGGAGAGRARWRTGAFALAAGCFATAASAAGWLAAGAAGLLAVLVAACVLTLVHLTRGRLPAVPYAPLKPAGSGEQDPYDRYRRLYNRLSWGQVSARHFDGNTRPALTRIAAARLLERRGIDLLREPAAAREALGPRLYELLDPARPDSTDRTARAVPLSEVDRLVRRLEEL